ncbi:MAG: sugar phosphate isomerase/epimerase family protein [Candidatus Thorarchaeota archaeon]
MDLGISSLGHIVEYGRSNKYDNILDLFLKATEECLIFAERNNITIVELVLDPPEIIYDENQQRFFDLLSNFSLKTQIHGPFIDLSLCSHNFFISNVSVEIYIKTAKICKEIGADLLTIHPGLVKYPLFREYNKQQIAHSIHKLLDETAALNVNICLENMPKSNGIMGDEETIKEVFNLIQRSDLYITYDTSHFFTCDGNIIRLWEYFGDIIKNVHIVENFSKTSDTHPPLGTGKINFDEIFEVLGTHQYQGPLIIELSTAKDLPESIDYLHKFL